MQVISAALAFAITMLALAMVASTLVETIHRIFGLRERGLYYMLGQLYDHVLQYYLPSDKQDVKTFQDRMKTFQDRMTENRSPVAVAAPAGPARTASQPVEWNLAFRPFEWKPSSILRWLGDVWRGRGLSNLTAAGFMERLGGHPLSDDIIAKAETEGKNKATAATAAAPPAVTAAAPAPVEDFVKREIDAVLQDVAQKFEAFATEASVFFERRARSLSVVVAVAVAFVLHVDAIDLFKTFLRDPSVAEAVIARKDDFTKSFEASKTDAEMRLSHPPAAPSGTELLKFQQAVKDAEALKKEYKDAVAKLNGAQTQLTDLGVPIGWNEEREKAAVVYPIWRKKVCRAPGKPPRDVKDVKECKADETAGTRNVLFFPRNPGVILGLLFGGLLIGLGGPFWYDAVKSLTSIRDVARGTQSAPAPTTPASAAAPAAPAGAGGTAETPQPRTPVDVFKTARAGWIAAGRP
jgi:hypothetical protein